MAEQPQAQPVNCPNCGNQIGEEIDVKGTTLLHAGGGIVRKYDGWCIQCGTAFYWSVNEKQLEQLVRDILDGRS